MNEREGCAVKAFRSLHSCMECLAGTLQGLRHVHPGTSLNVEGWSCLVCCVGI